MTQPLSTQVFNNVESQSLEKKKSRTCEVISLSRSTGPHGEKSSDWFRYEISSPGSSITGYRRGKKSDVLAYLDECISQLNERLKSGKSIPSAPRGPKPKQVKAID